MLIICILSKGLLQDTKLGEEASTVESVFPSAKLPTKFHLETLWSYCVSCAIDFTPGQGDFLRACVESRTPVLCFGLTEKHNKCLEEHLKKWVVKRMATEGSSLHRKNAKEVLENLKKRPLHAGGDNGETEGEPTEKKPKNREPKTKPKPKDSKKKDQSSESVESAKKTQKKGKSKKSNKTTKKKKEESSSSSSAEPW